MYAYGITSADIMMWLIWIVMAALAVRAIQPSATLTNMVTPNPVEIGKALYVRCSVDAIGGVEMLPGIGPRRVVNGLTLKRTLTNRDTDAGINSMLARYYTSLRKPFDKIYGDLPDGVSTDSFTMAGGGESGNYTNNAATIHITMRVARAGDGHVSAYVCKVNYLTSYRPGGAARGRSQTFTENAQKSVPPPAAPSTSPWKTEQWLGKRYIDLQIPAKPAGGNQKACQDIGAFLPEPKSKRESDFLAKLTTKSFRLGMRHRRDPYGNHVWLWDKSGAGVAFHDWIGFPKKRGIPLRADRRCAAMVKGRWNDVACDSHNGTDTVVCEKEPADLPCGRGGIDFAAARADGKLQPPAMLISVALGLCRLIYYM